MGSTRLIEAVAVPRRRCPVNVKVVFVDSLLLAAVLCAASVVIDEIRRVRQRRGRPGLVDWQRDGWA